MNRAQRRKAAKATQRKRPAHISPREWAQMQASPEAFVRIPPTIRFSRSDELNLQIIPHSLLQGFREGLGAEQDWHALAFRLNWGFVHAGAYYPEGVPAMLEALAALTAVKERAERQGQWGLSQAEYEALHDGLNITDAMQRGSTRKELKASMDTMQTMNQDALVATHALSKETHERQQATR